MGVKALSLLNASDTWSGLERIH